MVDSDQDQALTLGKLYRTLRVPLGSQGATRVILAFEQHMSLSTRQPQKRTIFSLRKMDAHLDFEDDLFVRADLRTGGLADETELRIMLRRQDTEYVYSVD